MPARTNYQNNSFIKNSNSKNSLLRGKNSTQLPDMTEDEKERFKQWVTFFRNNISFFVEFFLDVRLFPFQRYWINAMHNSTDFLAIAARGTGKSWLIAVYSIAKCILYPGTIVSLNSSTKAQAGLIISEKCQQLYNDHPMIQRETVNIVTNQNIYEMTFQNGSRIIVVISGEGGRGHRSHCVVLEERRLIPTEVIDSIIRPFLVRRIPPYIKNAKYAYLLDKEREPQTLTITSAYYKSHDWWIEAKKLIKMMASGDPDVRVIFLDYLIGLKHGIKTKKQMQKEKEKMDDITFLMENGNIPYSSSSSSFFKVGLFNRNIKVAWRPIKEDNLPLKKNPYDIPRKVGERRIVSVDVAMRKGSVNDNTIITCARLFPTNKGWQTEVCYIESHNGKNALLQALRVKQIYAEFTGFTDGDILVLDLLNAGITLYDALTSITKDDQRNKEYDAMCVIRHPSIDNDVYLELMERCLSKDAVPCIYPISATQVLNSQIAVTFRDRLKKKLLKFLIDDNAEEEFLIKSGNKDIIDHSDITIRAYLLAPHVQTNLLINECISLDMTSVGVGLVKLEESGNQRKDRYSSVSYLNWVVSLFDKELLKDNTSKSDEQAILDITFVVSGAR